MFQNLRRIALALCAAMLLTAWSAPSLTFAKPPNKDDGGNANYAFVYHIVEMRGLFMTTIDGTDTFQLTRPTGRNFDSCPTWSPDLDLQSDGYQGQIAYIDDDIDGQNVLTLYVINPDGTGNRLVRSFEWFEPRPETLGGNDVLVWSPNGKEIVFSHYRGGNPSTNNAVYAVEVATGDVRMLLDGANAPSISPLGLLAFQFQGDIHAVEYLLDENGLMQIDPLAEWVNITASATADEWPVWSPDGTYLAFMSTDRSADPRVTQLIVYDLLLDEFITVVQDADAWPVTWSPDGSEIGFLYGVEAGTYDIYRITDWDDPDLRQFIRVTLTDRLLEYQPRWNPGWIAP